MQKFGEMIWNYPYIIYIIYLDPFVIYSLYILVWFNSLKPFSCLLRPFSCLLRPFSCLQISEYFHWPKFCVTVTLDTSER